jgi:predicted acylesterase/phospholipase RssA
VGRVRRKRVFILGGGAALGAHQVGVMRRLDEEGIRPDAIVGSSIGVVNACLYTSGGVDNMESAWREISRKRTVFRPSLRHNPVAGLSLFSMDTLSSAIEGYVDFDAVHTSPIELSFILLNLSRGEGQFFSNHQAKSPSELRQMSRAGYAIPVLFPPVRFRGELYVDGGFAWNVPLLQAVEMGATEIYVLSVVAPSLPFKRKFGGFVDYSARLADVLWRTLGNVGFVTTKIEADGTYRGVPVTIFHPTEELAGFNPMNLLSTSQARSGKLMSAGYRDATRELARVRRTTRARRPASVESLEVEPAFRHEVA